MPGRETDSIRCPISRKDAEWIETRWKWLVGKIGPERVRSNPVVLPTPEYFPDKYSGTVECARKMFHRIAAYMGVPAGAVELSFYYEQENTAGIHGHRGTAGLYWDVEGQQKIGVAVSNLKEPVALAAVLAHELGHVCLLGNKLVTSEVQDHEPLTDLLTVCLGLGVMTSNAVIHEHSESTALTNRWEISRRGYLSMSMYGYALACFAETRGEEEPSWLKNLRPDVRWSFQNAVRYRASGDLQSPLKFDPEDVNRTDNELAVIHRIVGEQSYAESETEIEDSGHDVTSLTAEELLSRYRDGSRDFRDLDLRRLQLDGAMLAGCNFAHADMRGCNLANADLSKVNFYSANLADAVLTGSKLGEANLKAASLLRANLSNADLEKANVGGVDFRLADLTHTNLSECLDFRSAAFHLANIEHAVLSPVMKRYIDGTSSVPTSFIVGSIAILWKLVLAVVALFCISGAVMGILGSMRVQYPFSVVFVSVACLIGLSGVLVSRWIGRMKN